MPMDKLILSSIPMSELLTELRTIIQEELKGRQDLELPREELMTRLETSRLLGITLPTLREYTTKGLIKGYRMGSRVLYKRTEVIHSLQEISTKIKKRRI
jgi:excisionase family DNA binding protein